jgi:hypothetical protein
VLDVVDVLDVSDALDLPPALGELQPATANAPRATTVTRPHLRGPDVMPRFCVIQATRAPSPWCRASASDTDPHVSQRRE